MKVSRRSFVASVLSSGLARAQTKLSPQQEIDSRERDADWMLHPERYVARIERTQAGRVTLSNGILSRTFCLSPNAATIGFIDETTGANLLRGVRPEAEITINDVAISIGGLYGAPVPHYFDPKWLPMMQSHPADYVLSRIEEGKTAERFAWKRVPQWSTETLPWPPPGVALTFHYGPGPESVIRSLAVKVHYELYDGIPLLSKWIEVENHGSETVTLNTFNAEVLAIHPRATAASAFAGDASLEVSAALGPLHVETDYAFGGSTALQASRAVRWRSDPAYSAVSGDDHQQPSLFECTPPLGPELAIGAGESWSSFRVFELLFDSDDRERRGLAQRKMMRTLAPWTQENPIYMHARYAEPAKAREVIDQCAAVGFEMVILSFGSGFDIENEAPSYLDEMAQLAAYAKSKGIAIGGYSLLSSRGGKPEDLVVDVKTDRPGGWLFGPSPCLGSRWAEGYFRKLHRFFPKTGMTVFENDGSYPGDTCASTEHPGHRGYLDSQWQQWQIMSKFYQWCRGQGIYLTVPDWYYLQGSSKTGMGYTESDWSLPREYQPVIERQDIYDGTWEKTPSMGWMLVPLMTYEGGGTAATVEPLRDHLAHYETRLADLFGAGVQATWRGSRLYDCDETRAVVAKWVSFYKQYRAILDSDIIHLRRPDGSGWDGILHVNPKLKERGLAVIYNPGTEDISAKIRLPLYYTGATKSVSVETPGSGGHEYLLDRDYSITIEVAVPANGRTVLVVR